MTIAKRSWSSPSDVRSVENRSGSIGKIPAAVCNDVVFFFGMIVYRKVPSLRRQA
jgi:hypothetical protein